MNQEELSAEYGRRYSQVLQPLAKRLESYLIGVLQEVEHIDRICARAKAPTRFIEKASKKLENGETKYRYPLDQIQDLVGARVVVLYKQDVETISSVIDRYLRHIEHKDIVPDAENQFGYVGKHFIAAFPEDVLDDEVDRMRTPQFFELQVKTLFQHAWSEAEHDMTYKPQIEFSSLQRRQIAFTAAQAWGADEIFSQLVDDIHKRTDAVISAM